MSKKKGCIYLKLIIHNNNLMNQHYFINSSNINQNIENIRLNDYNASVRLSTDDLLSTHPLVFSENNETDLKNNRISTEREEKVIIVSSENRNFIYESLFDFKILFNKSSTKFVNIPVYYNNPTVPQNIYEREEGISGSENTEGWVDITGKKYPKYNPNLDKGDIISYDSVLDKQEKNVSVNTDNNNILSIKLVKAIIPENLFNSDDNINSTYVPSINYLRLNIKPLDNNYNSSNSQINTSTEILVRQKNLDQGFTYFPISNYELIFSPPRNGLNQFNLTLRPNYFPEVLDSKQKMIFDKFFSGDVISVLDIYFFKSVIKIKTTYFKLSCWRDGMIIKFKNLLPNLMRNKSVNFTLLKSIDTYFNENPIIILNTHLTDENDSIIEGSLLGNTIIIAAPFNPNTYYQDINSNEISVISNELKSIIPNSILVEFEKKYFKYFNTLFNFSKFAETLASLKTLKINFKERIESTPTEGDTLIINMSMQCLYMFKITYLRPKIDFNKTE